MATQNCGLFPFHRQSSELVGIEIDRFSVTDSLLRTEAYKNSEGLLQLRWKEQPDHKRASCMPPACLLPPPIDIIR